MSSERYIPNYDFEPGELMPWQEMSKRLKELAETCSELASIIGAEYSAIKTRLDDLEETMGKMSPNQLCSDDEAARHDSIDHYYGSLNFEKECYDSQVYIEAWIPGNRPEETTGTHPPNCRCAWCEPQGGQGALLWGS